MKKVRLYEAFHNIDEASKSQVYVAAKKGSYPATIVVVKGGKVVHQQSVNTPQEAPAVWSVIQGEYPNGKIHLEDSTGKVLIREGVEVNEGTWAFDKNAVEPFIKDLKKVKSAKEVTKLKDKYYNKIGDDLLYDALDRAEGANNKDALLNNIADAIGRLEDFIKESVVTESIEHGSYYFSKASAMIDNLLPAGGWKRGETKYAVICHNTVQMGKNVMYLKSANSKVGQNFEAHILSIHDTEEEAFSAYVETVKYDGGKTDTCVSYAYGTLDSKGSNYPFNEIGGERKVIK